VSTTCTALPDDGHIWVDWKVERERGGGWAWYVEAVGANRFSRQALGHAATRWGAWRKVKKHRRQWISEAREA